MKIAIIDTETTGLPKNYNASYRESENWPHIVQIACIVGELDENLEFLTSSIMDVIVKPGVKILNSNLHGITDEIATEKGQNSETALEMLHYNLESCQLVIAHNFQFDSMVLMANSFRCKNLIPSYKDLYPFHPESGEGFCTMSRREILNFVKKQRGGYGYAWPSLAELYDKLFGKHFDGAHNALNDSQACLECYIELRKLSIV